MNVGKEWKKIALIHCDLGQKVVLYVKLKQVQSAKR